MAAFASIEKSTACESRHLQTSKPRFFSWEESRGTRICIDTHKNACVA
jgi:hypothetical protein